MIRSRYLSAFTLAALLGAAPAFAQFTDSAKTATAKPTAANPTAKPLCSELGHPQAGKLADKDTGMAKERSSSPVHMDCIPDSQAPTSAAAGTNAPAGTNAAAGTSAAA